MAAEGIIELPSRATVALPPVPGAEDEALGQALGLSPTVAQWLKRRGLDDRAAAVRFLQPRLADLTPPDGMAGRRAAAQRLAEAVQGGETVCVFGDYDCDGITATAIMTEVLRTLGASAAPLLASRFDGGYGVSDSAVARILATNAKLIITCDCGSSDHQSLQLLADAGRDVVVIDHHLVPDQALPALAFLNPHREDCLFSFKGLASCGLALSVGAALRTELGVPLDLRRWLDLVAIGTIADVAPLARDNRALVRAGLVSLSAGSRPGVRALLRLAGHEPGEPLNAEDVAFRIAPRLNAPGRLGRPDLALDLLLARDSATADALATRIEELQVERRRLQDVILQEACEEIDREGYSHRPAIVIGRENWNHGIVGIVAGRLAERYHRPVIVVGFEGSHGRGSLRGPRGIELFDALKLAAPALVRFGGHQAAAGLEVTEQALPKLRELFENACEPLLYNSHSLPAPEHLLRMHPNDAPWQVQEDLCQLEPCGEGNPAPRLALEGEVLRARSVRGGHLKLELRASGHDVGGFGVSMGALAEHVVGPVVVIGTLRRDRWRGGRAVEIRAEAILR